ncbi:MAG: hypothetical protein JJE13_04915 [Thermoleophilia bacterium]|nr:hypothetical protein [Thermoleophilia bacterium]
MSLSPEQALDESSHRKVEGSFDELQRAARNIEREARSIEANGGEQRLVDLLDKYSNELRVMLKQMMSEAYYRPQEPGEQAAEARNGHLPEVDVRPEDEDQASLFGESGDDTLAA